MKQKYLYIIAAVVVISVCLVVILPIWRSQILPKKKQNSIVTGVAPVAPLKESISPSIEGVNGRLHEGAKPSLKEPTSLAQVYSQYPAEDTGNNMVASWARVSPQEKVKAVEQLDQQITEAKETLKIKPSDKKAKHVLFISETLKKMCKSNFDLSLLETVPQDQGGLKPRSKK